MARTLDKTKGAAILQAARTVFLRDGYQAAKMSDIAAEAGVAPGTLYIYFDSKESLANALGDECFLRFSSGFAQVIKKLDTPAGVTAMLDWAMREGVRERDILALVKQSKPNPKAPAQARERLVQPLAHTLNGFMLRGLVRHYEDPSNLAVVVLAILHRIIMSSAIYEDSQPEQVKNAAVNLLQHALYDDLALKRLASGSKRQSEKVK
jgi:AcrR family transcriptional regulator